MFTFGWELPMSCFMQGFMILWTILSQEDESNGKLFICPPDVLAFALHTNTAE
jgi:hypothetical protein